jgi:type I restriction enzyme, R subunit
MTLEVSERSFEETIEYGLLRYGSNAVGGAGGLHEPSDDNRPGGYRKRKLEDYDRTLCLLPRDAIDFILATQPKDWNELADHYGPSVKEQFLKRVASEIERRGVLDVLRNGIKDSGIKFRLAYFRPASGLNEETQKLHAANLFSLVRQLRYSTKNEKCLSGIVPQWYSDLHNRIEEPADRTEH